MLSISCRMLTLLALVGIAAVPAHAGVPVGTAIVLEANFDNRLPGATLGAGGAAAGEPADLSALDGVILQASPGDNYLRVSNNTGNTTGRSLRWEFLNDLEITEGKVLIRLSLTPSSLDRYSFGVRENGGSSRTFLGVTFATNGTFSASDAAGVITVTNNAYGAGTELAVVIEFDMDARTSQMTVNGLPVFAGRSHGILDRGVGRVLTGYSSSHSATPFDLDDFSVEADVPLALVLDADFQDQPLGQAIGTGGAELGQPFQISPGLPTLIVDDGLGNRALRLQNPSTGSARSVRWEFLDNLEVDSGSLAFDVDVQFAVLDGYQLTVRESGGSASSFCNLRFLPNGGLSLSDANGVAPLPPVSYAAGQLYRVRLIYDLDAGTYSAFLDDTALVVGRAHGVSNGRGVGAMAFGFLSTATTAAMMFIDDLQVGAADAPVLPSQVAFLVEPTNGLINRPLEPAPEVGVVTVFDQVVPDGTLVEVAIDSGPAGGTLTGTLEPTVAGTASFDALQANLPGTYRLRARSGRATQTSLVDITITTPPNSIFGNGFE
jgi:hypothetical protein